ncbi:hypothetical protein ACH4UV_02485 [Streptomyces sp. NPDC020802]|uniref:hypothetical protein n=1 Tax=unclassified Streptomyces TaxID=2593676 RepID=UPI0035A96465
MDMNGVCVPAFATRDPDGGGHRPAMDSAAAVRTVTRMKDNLFHGPLVRLRDEVPGHAVPPVKAGVTLRGPDAGGVRTPLLDPTPEHPARLAKLIDHGLEAARA